MGIFNFCDLPLPPIIFEEQERKIIFNYLEKKYEIEIKEIQADLTRLATNLIKGKNFLTDLSNRIKNLSENSIQKKKKIFLLGETGVGKSTLINCIEQKMLAPESKYEAPTTMKYTEYESEKYHNYIFCDTRGIEKKNFAQIEKENINIILDNIKENSYLFWFLKGSSSNFQDTDAKFIKSFEKKLNGNIPLFFVITKSTDEEEDKNKLNETIKEYFPYNKNIPIFPLYARGTKRMPSFGLEELMEETKTFFEKIIIQESFKDIYGNDKIYNENFSKCIRCNDRLFDKEFLIHDLTSLFKIILNYIRLENINNIIANEEIQPIINFLHKGYSKFETDFHDIIGICILIKSKYEIINVNKVEQISSILTTKNNSINNSIQLIKQNTSDEDEILERFSDLLEGCSDLEKEKILLKVKKYYHAKEGEINIKYRQMRKGVEIIIKWFFGAMFDFELKKEIEKNLLKINGLFD